jgi:hypothetical protein
MGENYLDLPRNYGSGDQLESQRIPDPRLHRQETRARFLRVKKRDNLAALMPTPPEKGYSYHLLINGKADFWPWVPHMVQWCGKAAELYCSTWTLNRACCTELFELLDAGTIQTASFLTGLYFKRRETAVYATLLQGLRARGLRYISFENHTKVTLIRGQDGRHLVAEGSANLTANPRLEQVVLTDDEQVYAFHREWMEEMLSDASH